MAYGLGAGDVTSGSSYAANVENLWHFCPHVCFLPVYVYFLFEANLSLKTFYSENLF